MALVKRKLVIGLCILAVGIFLFWDDIYGFRTLDEAVNARFKSPMQIVNQDAENRLVMFKDKSQYVLGVYRQWNGRFYYKNDSGSSGWTASTMNGPAFLVVAEKKPDRGNFVWGALYTDIPVRSFLVEYKNGDVQEVNASQNTFLVKMPEIYRDTSELGAASIVKSVNAYGMDNQLIKTWK